MMDEQKKTLIDTLTRFVDRVCEGNYNNESEIIILPEIVRELRLLAYED